MMRLGDLKTASDIEAEAGIDIGPLVDIIFILLIFFMVSTTFAKQVEVPIERPSARSTQAATPKAIRVAISRSGRLFLEGHAIQSWMLQERVRQLLRSRRQQAVLISADAESKTKLLIDAVDQCRLAGAKHVAVEARKE